MAVYEQFSLDLSAIIFANCHYVFHQIDIDISSGRHVMSNELTIFNARPMYVLVASHTSSRLTLSNNTFIIKHLFTLINLWNVITIGGKSISMIYGSVYFILS